RILIGVCSCRKHAGKRAAIRETWMSESVEGIEAVFFVGGKGELKGEEDTVVVEEPTDNYEYLPSKVRAFFRHALEEHEFDWIFKCDDDTYTALSRIHDLVDNEFDIIGNQCLTDRGAPSGGAGYFLNRKFVEKLVADESLPLTGDEDIIIGRAAILHGARPKSTPRLRLDASLFPKQDNNIVSAHWCSIDRMKAIHAIFTTKPSHTIHVRHPLWNDSVSLYENGTFKRNGSGCCGTWALRNGRNLSLHWFDWEAESFLPSSSCPENSTIEQYNTYVLNATSP
ncbi:MAG: nucleotide-diphospho-sugar transferase, partial [Verrucomicrobiales bacterium]|nr:nucleotide-diphospho-sugar transferase [Verrucomicrobiales bacterium]